MLEMSLETISLVILTAVLAVASLTDFWKGKIYHHLTIPAVFIGVGLNVYIWTTNSGMLELVKILTIPAIAFGLSYGLYRFGKFGGGDVMLFTAISAFIPAYFFQVLAFTFVLILPTSLIYAAIKGEGEFTDREVEFPSAPLFAGAVLISQFTTVLVI